MEQELTVTRAQLGAALPPGRTKYRKLDERPERSTIDVTKGQSIVSAFVDSVKHTQFTVIDYTCHATFTNANERDCVDIHRAVKQQIVAFE